MASYPVYTSVPQDEPYIEEIEFKTLLANFDDLGAESRKRKWLYPKRNITVRHSLLTKAEARTLWQFYQARSGPYEAFNYFVPMPDTYVGEYVGTGDASTTVFNLPSKLASSYTLYVDGVTQTEGGVDYTFASEGGTDGADKVTFVAAPGDGTRITWDFTGNLKVRCRYQDDRLSFDQFWNAIINMGLTLKGILNA